MKNRVWRKWLIAAGVAGVAAVAIAIALAWVSEPSDPDAPSRAQLEQLLQKQATRTDIEATLGTTYRLYEKGRSEWSAFESSGSMHPERVLTEMKKYPKVMFYTTAWHRTYIFLDNADVITAYVTAGQ